MDCLSFTFQCDNKQHIQYIIEKGYIAIDGISLTVTNVDVRNYQFKIMLVQYTQSKVTLSKKEIHEKVNIECDIIGKQIVNYISNYEKVLKSKL